MKVWNSFPMLRFILPFLVGVISWAFLLEIVTIDAQALVIAGVITSAISVLFLVATSKKRKQYLFGLALWPSLYVLGGLLTVSVSDFIYPNYLNQDRLGYSHESFLALIVDQPQVKEKSVKVVVNLSNVDETMNGKVLLYFEKDSASSILQYGERILIRTKLQQVEGLGNPNEFNYSRYLRFHNIIFRGYVKSNNWSRLSDAKPSLKGWFLAVRSHLIEKLEASGLFGNELSVASALILGYRTDLDKELMTAYAGAGATHVLAVSGLHVGIVYIILNTVLKFLDKRKYGRILRTILIVLLLFSYAGLTGLSASVFRAATMFSFVAIGQAINRNTNIFNTLAASAFCLILYEPMIIMQVGFQLSYAAVIGIVLIQPRLFKLKSFDNRFLDWAWSITCVSIAAQIATFPLGLLYFHQFPNLFLVSNLLVIPAAAGILYLGFSLFLLSFWEPTLLFFGFLLNTLISSLNQVVMWIEKVPYSVLSGIDISILEAILIYSVIACFLFFLIQKRSKALLVSLSLLVVFMVLQVIEVYNQRKQQFVALYNVKGETALALVNGTKATFIASERLWANQQAMLFHVRHHWWNRGVDCEQLEVLNDSLINTMLNWNGSHFAVISMDKSDSQFQFSCLDSLDFVVINKIGWSQLESIENLGVRHVYVSNSLGVKTKQKLFELYPENKFYDLAERGAMILE